MLAEEYDPVAKRLVGNFPQAFSHIVTEAGEYPSQYCPTASSAAAIYGSIVVRSMSRATAAGGGSPFCQSL